MPNIRETYETYVMPKLQKERYENPMAVPRIQKVVVNVGLGRRQDKKEQEEVMRFLEIITGQRSSPRPAKQSIAAFKTRKGQIIGCKVTLRGDRMYDFLSRLVGMALPRTRDFRGIPSSSVDGRGNLTIGIKEHIVFPEVIGEDYHFLFGLEATVVTSASTKAEGLLLFKLLGFPIET